LFFSILFCFTGNIIGNEIQVASSFDNFRKPYLSGVQFASFMIKIQIEEVLFSINYKREPPSLYVFFLIERSHM